MTQTGDHPASVAIWILDEETGEVVDPDSYTNW